MTVAIKQSINIDNIIGGVNKLVSVMEEAMGDLSKERQPVANVLYDALVYMGLPANAIQLALGCKYVIDINGDETTAFFGGFPEGIRPDAHCDFCDGFANYLCPTPAGYRLSCENHISMIKRAIFNELIISGGLT